MTSLMMSSCCTLRLKRRRAFSRDSPSCSRISAKQTHPQTSPVGPNSYYKDLAGSQEGEEKIHQAACFDFRALPRANDSPRLSSAVRSDSSVATCTGLPDSLPSQEFSSSEVVAMKRPWRRTGIPSEAQRLTTETGSPRKVAICCQPLRITGFDWLCPERFHGNGMRILRGSFYDGESTRLRHSISICLLPFRKLTSSRVGFGGGRRRHWALGNSV